jgi:quercetin dioxygenase-like cupin family protein
VEHLTATGTFAVNGGAATYREHLRFPSLSFGTYCIPAGAVDPQRPHTEDEIYVVAAGRATFSAGGQVVQVAPGDVLFVPAREEHRFSAVSEGLTVLVFFAPAEQT